MRHIDPGSASACVRRSVSVKDEQAVWGPLVSDGRRGAMQVGCSGAVGCGSGAGLGGPQCWAAQCSTLRAEFFLFPLQNNRTKKN